MLVTNMSMQTGVAHETNSLSPSFHSFFLLLIVFLHLPTVVGIGMSAGAILFGEIARTSLKKERTAVFALFMATRQIGLVFGEYSNNISRGGMHFCLCFIIGVTSAMAKLRLKQRLVSV